MKVGILGSGMVGRDLAVGFMSENHEVMIGSRTPDKEELTSLKSEHSALHLSSFEGAAQFGELIILASKGEYTIECLEMAGMDNLEGKIVIDVTNPLIFTEAGVKPEFVYPESLGKQVQEWLPKSHVVKAWNTVNSANMYNPSFQDGTPTMPICGNDEDSKEAVIEILNAFGWTDVVDMGGIEKSYLLESLTIFWIEYAILNDTWSHGFSLLKS